MSPKEIRDFQKLVWDFYKTNGRDFAWRRTTDPYKIVVSEIMLQQTQTTRVAEKFPEFLKKFPTFKALAKSTPAEVILAWQGLGYNRRALFLRELARTVVNEHKGKLPQDPEELIKLPGIGKNTAGSVAAFAFNAPTVFIETNIRSVFLHYFFPGQTNIPDTDLVPLIAATVPPENPREWYWALMDLGVHIKKSQPNPSRASKHHTKQSKFIGSKRQVRGAILRELATQPHTEAQLLKKLTELSPLSVDEFKAIITSLIKEGFIEKLGAKLTLKNN